MEQNENKSVRASIRLTPTTYEFVNSYKGKSFNDKFENLVRDIMNESKSLNYRDSLYSDIQNLEKIKASLQNLEDSIADFTNTKNHVELIEKNNPKISNMITAAGYRTSQSLIHNISQLNRLTKRENSIKDICGAYKNNTYETANPECQCLVDSIGQEFKVQQFRMQELIAVQ